MILSHIEGINRIDFLRAVYQKELECLCLNNEFMDISTLIPHAKSLLEKYPDRVVFKESEFHDEETPYYEFSLFCNESELTEFKNIIKNSNLEIDIIHDTDDAF
jgi:hypothetical protein